LLTGLFVPFECLVSWLESTQCYALPWVIHQLLTWLFVPFDHSYFVFIWYKILCITCDNILPPNWNICTFGYSVFQQIIGFWLGH
jgi:hypothetical protein